MATVGNKRRVYITDSLASTHTVLAGEQSNSFSRSMATVEVSDKDTDWANFLAGKKSATADVTLNLDNTATDEQHKLLQSFEAGLSVFVFIGQLSSGSRSEGDAFEALITAINDSNDQESVCSRTISLQVTGEPVHYPATNSGSSSSAE